MSLLRCDPPRFYFFVNYRALETVSGFYRFGPFFLPPLSLARR